MLNIKQCEEITSFEINIEYMKNKRVLKESNVNRITYIGKNAWNVRINRCTIRLGPT